MLLLRRLALGLAALAAVSLAVSVSGARADSYPYNQSFLTLTSTHFRIHFSGDYALREYLPSARANDVLGFAERAYSTYTGLGYTVPVDDGDGNGRIELWVEDLNQLGEPYTHYSGYVTATTPGSTTTAGAIHMDIDRGVLVDVSDPTAGIDGHAVAHEVFNLFQWRIFHDTGTSYRWLEEATAEWAAFQVPNTRKPDQNALGETDRSIDCIGSECGYLKDDVDDYDAFYDRNANTGWSFFQHLSEKYGSGVVKDVWSQAAADGVAAPPTQPVDEVLAGKGSLLSNAFNSWTTARLNGAFTMTGIKDVLPFTFATVKTGSSSGAIPTQVAAVGHLAARYIELKPSDGGATDACLGATMALSVSIPAGVTSAPYVFVNAIGNSPQAMTVSGSTATLTLPWSTCANSPAAYISLPNATVDPAVNGTEFLVSGTLTIDPNAQPTAPPPPPAIKMPGTVVSVPTTDSPPSIEVFGPELIQLDADQRVLRLIVSSDGQGKLLGALGSLSLGSVALRTGNNDIRFNLSASALSTLRRTAATGGLLTLTPLSSQGTQGKVVKRRVAIDGVIKPAPKAKATPKKKAKAKVKAKAKTAKTKTAKKQTTAKR